MRKLKHVTSWLALGLTVFATSAVAVELPKGLSEIRLNGSLQTDTPVGTSWAVGGGYGYFFAENLEVGGILQLEDNDVLTSYSFGPFVEYNFPNESQWVPYIGISGLWFGTDPGEADSQDSFVARGSAGVKYFVSNAVAIFGSGNFDWSPDDLFLDENLETNDTQFLFELGVRFYIGR